MYQQDDDGPKVGGAFAAAFLLLALVCLGAFGAVAGGAFKPLPVARLLVAPGKVERALGRDIGRKDKAVDQRLPAMTASIGAAPICNFEACGRAFLVSDLQISALRRPPPALQDREYAECQALNQPRSAAFSSISQVPRNP
jgi:hypothetical protein